MTSRSASKSSSLPHRPSRPQNVMPHIQDANPVSGEDPEAAADRRQKIRVRNRRKSYLDRHPSYFSSPDLELTGTRLNHFSSPIFVSSTDTYRPFTV